MPAESPDSPSTGGEQAPPPEVRREPTRPSAPACFPHLERRWPLVLAAGLLGWALALAFSALRPPVYEAVAAFQVGLDYGRSAPLELVVEDRVLDRVWQLVVSDETLRMTIESLQTDIGPALDWESPAALRRHTRLDARLSRWELIGIDEDPGVAAAIANAWMGVTIQRLEDAIDHAWKAVELQGTAFRVGCFFQVGDQPVEVFWQCFSGGPGLTAQRTEEVRQEIAASHGILPIVSFELIEEAARPQKAVLYARGLVTLSGALIGMILGGTIIALRGSEASGKGGLEAEESSKMD